MSILLIDDEMRRLSTERVPEFEMFSREICKKQMFETNAYK